MQPDQTGTTVAQRKALLVLAHPNPDSFCASLARQARIALAEGGWSVDLLDLYAEGFDPVLSIAERLVYFRKGAIRAEADLRDRLQGANDIVLVFPTWWFSMPAILKGWFDRVWAPDIAFVNGTPIRPLLTQLKTCTVVTTLGSPWWVDRLVMHRPVRRVLKTALIGACAPRASFKMLSLYRAEADEPARFERFVERLTKLLSRL